MSALSGLAELASLGAGGTQSPYDWYGQPPPPPVTPPPVTPPPVTSLPVSGGVLVLPPPVVAGGDVSVPPPPVVGAGGGGSSFQIDVNPRTPWPPGTYGSNSGSASVFGWERTDDGWVRRVFDCCGRFLAQTIDSAGRFSEHKSEFGLQDGLPFGAPCAFPAYKSELPDSSYFVNPCPDIKSYQPKVGAPKGAVEVGPWEVGGYGVTRYWVQTVQDKCGRIGDQMIDRNGKPYVKVRTGPDGKFGSKCKKNKGKAGPSGSHGVPGVPSASPIPTSVPGWECGEWIYDSKHRMFHRGCRQGELRALQSASISHGGVIKINPKLHMYKVKVVRDPLGGPSQLTQEHVRPLQGLGDTVSNLNSTEKFVLVGLAALGIYAVTRKIK
jgi:hypothetical protein